MCVLTGRETQEYRAFQVFSSCGKFAIRWIQDDVVKTMRQIVNLGLCGRESPQEILIDLDEKPFDQENWLDSIPGDSEDFRIHWGDWVKEQSIVSDYKNILVAALKPSLSKLWNTSALPWLNQLGFSYATFRMNDNWSEEYGYRPPGFADNLPVHGWACAFKGEGHNRLVSRRWLEWGPWRLIRDEAHDISFVQFHDLEADAATALEQAKPGHQRMGIEDEGGFIQSHYCYDYPPKGIYISSEKRLDIVVTPGRTISQAEMLDAAAARNLGHFAQPVDSICYIFYDEEQAREHLHEMWLRELQVYWINMEGEKVRLDDSYDPGVPVKPDWVLELERREA